LPELNSHHAFKVVILLGVLAMLGPVAHDIFVPAMPIIADGLNSNTSQVSVSISAIFLGGAIGTLFHGPLADRYGRKIIILWVLGIYTVAAIAAAFSSNVETLIILRFFQGLAVAGGRVLSATVARDLFEKENLGKVMSNIMFMTAIAAVIAPLVGGYTAKHLPWQSTFLFMAIFASFVFILFLLVFKERSIVERKDSLHIRLIFRDVKTITSNWSFLVYSVTGGLMLAGFIAFLSVSANIIIASYGVSADIYGFLFASVCLSILFGTFVGSRLVTKIGLTRMIKWGVVFGLFGGSLMLFLALLGIRTSYAVIVPMWIFMLGYAFVSPNTVASALQPFPNFSGTASSLTNFIQGIIGVTVSFVISFFPQDDALVLALTLFFLGCAAVLSIRLKLYNP
jgi:DHA1 family bicyclomycin/chloramphenicol resistance-like MFS transporter